MTFFQFLFSCSHLEAFGITDTDRKRSKNEDSILCLPDHGVFLVADGIGGASGGMYASGKVVQFLEKAFNGLLQPSQVSIAQMHPE